MSDTSEHEDLLSCKLCGMVAVSTVYARYMSEVYPCVNAPKKSPTHVWVYRRLSALQSIRGESGRG